jgi:hypothetical protein
VDAQQFRARGRCGIRALTARLGDDDVRGILRAAAHARRGLLQRTRDREDAVDADDPVDHRRARTGTVPRAPRRSSETSGRTAFAAAAAARPTAARSA